MKLLDFPRAPNPRRVRIFIAEKGLDIPVEVVDIAAGANRSPEFLAKNPLGLLPVLELDDGRCLSESVAICRYLEGVKPEPALMGVDPEDTAMIEMWNRRLELELFLNGVGAYFRNTAAFFAEKYVQSPEAAAEAKRKATEQLAWLDSVLADRPFVAGSRFSIADITALVAVDLGTPSVFEVAPEQKHLARWHGAVSSRPSAGA